MVKRNHSEDSLRLSLKPAVIVGFTLPTRRRKLGRIVDGVPVKGDDVSGTQFPRRLGVRRRVLGIEAKEEQVVVSDEFVYEVVQSPHIVVAIGQLQAVLLQRL